MYKLSRAEQETVVIFNAAEREAQIYSACPAVLTKLDKLTAQFPDTYKCTKADQYGKTYTAPARFIRFGRPASEAVKAASRIKAARINSMR